jgi:hypothetical protein
MSLAGPIDPLGFYCGYLGKEAALLPLSVNLPPAGPGSPPPLKKTRFVSDLLWSSLTPKELDSYTFPPAAQSWKDMESAAKQGVTFAKQYLKNTPKPPTKGYILNRDLAKRVRVIQLPIPQILGFPDGGMTLGRFIFLNSRAPRRTRSRSGRSALVAHELGHVRQQDQAGVIPFLSKYLSDYARNRRHMSHYGAYANLPDERDADAGRLSWETRRNAEFKERERVAYAADMGYSSEKERQATEDAYIAEHRSKRVAAEMAEHNRRRVHAWWGKNYPRARDAVKDIPRRVGEIWNDKSK